MAKTGPSVTLSLTLLAAGALVLILGFQVARFFLVEDITRAQSAENPDLAGINNVFKDMRIRPPQTRTPDEPSTYQGMPRLPLEAFEHNPKQGTGAYTLLILTDPACVSCRETVTDIVQQAAELPLKIVYQFLPERTKTAPEGSIEGGMFYQLAWHEGVFEAYHTALYASETALSLEQLSSLMTQAGVPLRQQRQTLVKHGNKILNHLEKDIAQAAEYNIIRPPVVFLNGYYISNSGLNKEKLASYIKRMQTGEPIPLN